MVNGTSIFNLKGLYGQKDLSFLGNNSVTIHMYIANNGNVGIGTTAPSYKLEVNGDVKMQYIIYFSNTRYL